MSNRLSRRSKADRLGAGGFGGAVRPVSARRQAVAAATGVPTDGVAPPTGFPPHRISLNPDNPRSSLGDLTEDGTFLALHLIRKMSDVEFDKMLRILNDHQAQRPAAGRGAP